MSQQAQLVYMDTTMLPAATVTLPSASTAGMAPRYSGAEMINDPQWKHVTGMPELAVALLSHALRHDSRRDQRIMMGGET